jgi:hypothetical protein
MNIRRIQAICLILILLTACGPATVPTSSATSTAAPTKPPTLTPSPTLTLTPTVTPTPTPIGLTEPRIAFVGKDSQGQLGIYIDGFYTRQPKKIISLTVPEERAAYLSLRWSPNGKKLMFVNNNSLNRESFFLFDTTTNLPQEITRVPSGQDVFGFGWSADGAVFYFSAASRSRPQAVSYKIDLSTRGVSQTNEVSSASHNSHSNGLTDCNWETTPQTIRDLTMGGVGGFGPNEVVYDRVCFYPGLGLYGGLKYNEETTEFVLLTEEGEEEQTLVTFPADFGLNGFMTLSTLLDASRVLVIGEGGVQGFGNGCCQFAYIVDRSEAPLDRTDKEIFAGWPHFIHAFGWSPDGLNYLIAERDWNDPNPEDRFQIVHAESGEVVYEYRMPAQVTPAFSLGQVIAGYDIVWPALP